MFREKKEVSTSKTKYYTSVREIPAEKSEQTKQINHLPIVIYEEKRQNGPWLIAKLGHTDITIGYLHYEITRNNEFYITNMQCDGHYYFKYIGNLLLEMACRKSEELKCSKIVLIAAYGSWPFYLKFGFKNDPRAGCSPKKFQEMQDFLKAEENKNKGYASIYEYKAIADDVNLQMSKMQIQQKLKEIEASQLDFTNERFTKEEFEAISDIILKIFKSLESIRKLENIDADKINVNDIYATVDTLLINMNRNTDTSYIQDLFKLHYQLHSKIIELQYKNYEPFYIKRPDYALPSSFSDTQESALKIFSSLKETLDKDAQQLSQIEEDLGYRDKLELVLNKIKVHKYNLNHGWGSKIEGHITVSKGAKETYQSIQKFLIKYENRPIDKAMYDDICAEIHTHLKDKLEPKKFVFFLGDLWSRDQTTASLYVDIFKTLGIEVQKVEPQVASRQTNV